MRKEKPEDEPQTFEQKAAATRARLLEETPNQCGLCGVRPIDALRVICEACARRETPASREHASFASTVRPKPARRQ